MKLNPLIMHIPHSSIIIPKTVRNQFVIDDHALNNEVYRMTDLYTNDLFIDKNLDSDSIIFPINRLVVDPERFLDDQLEPMTEKGMGVIYTRTSNGQRLRHPPKKLEREYLINNFYFQHHDQFNRIVENHLDKHGEALIIDCHSFPSIPLPYEFNQSKNRPDICIGTDEFHTPNGLTQQFIRLFQKKGYSVKINEPFNGSIVPGCFYMRDKRVYSIMIEVNRMLYMDEITGVKLPGYERLKSDINKILSEVTNMVFERSSKQDI